MTTLECYECDKPARWHVWYKNFSTPTTPPFVPVNIAYNTFCDEHAAAEMIAGRAGYPVEVIKLIADSLLPDDDRAKNRPK
jgi:hypothetical protein